MRFKDAREARMKFGQRVAAGVQAVAGTDHQATLAA
jgi:hypothetical protein